MKFIRFFRGNIQTVFLNVNNIKQFKFCKHEDNMHLIINTYDGEEISLDDVGAQHDARENFEKFMNSDQCVLDWYFQ